MRSRTQSADSGRRESGNNAGYSFFQVAGIVQHVKENERMKCDYITFNIQSPVKPEFFDIISVVVPHDLDIVCEPGDCVAVRGWIRAWQRDGRITLELVAAKVAPFDPAQLTKGARIG